MKQIIQNYKTGELEVVEVPIPQVSARNLLVKTVNSLISAGTERTKIETAQMSLIEKIITRLDLVKIVMTNIKQEGIIFTLKKAFNKLDTPITLGYSCAGEVLEVASDLDEFKVSDRVACVGEGYATHSEINLVSQDYAVKIPDNVDYQEASFVGLGAIALNSVELAQILSNEKVAVIGLGLIGQLVVQILKTKGCKVFGIEIDEEKIELAKKFGLDSGASPIKDDIEANSLSFTSNLGFDAVIISAASKNNLPIELAGKISRYKGRVILVGAMPIIIPRKDYYEKELFFSISSSFGAGLYYKPEKNRLYPYNYKSITIKENMQNFLKLISEKRVNVKPLITHCFKIEQAKEAYKLIKTNKEKYIGIIFSYDKKISFDKKVIVSSITQPQKEKSISIGFIGAGSFAQGYLLPELKKHKKVNLVAVATSSGNTARNVAKKFGFEYCTTDYNEILNDGKINCVFIATRHNLHSKFVIETLKKNKKVFVEKPLCLNETELKEIVSVYISQKNPFLMIGFNRRFSPFVVKLKEFFRNRVSSLVMSYRINAGYLPPEHWLHNPKIGGGRIIGEVCHFVDLLQYIANSEPVEVYAMAANREKEISLIDNLIVSIKFSDGSVGTINYNSKGDISFPRERLEVFCDSSCAIIDNFTRSSFTRCRITKKFNKLSRDMGHSNEIKNVIDAILNNRSSPIPFYEITSTTLATFKILESIQKEQPIKVNLRQWLQQNNLSF
ncbi:MAG: bi-domain-containing oxidoreductase [Candidatus Omnitrophica bacterium]|nr:bi-domain-containing oxidoreductase [Candidatus Omnitrophota bacterium]